MNRLQAALADIGKVLDQMGVSWALVGGIAVSVRAEPRFTRDVDLAALTPLATARDFKAVRRLVRLIEERNSHRGRDLSGEVELLEGAGRRT
jgi:hypothetical protein